jgi:hypothetical protein
MAKLVGKAGIGGMPRRNLAADRLAARARTPKPMVNEI